MAEKKEVAERELEKHYKEILRFMGFLCHRIIEIQTKLTTGDLLKDAKEDDSVKDQLYTFLELKKKYDSLGVEI